MELSAVGLLVDVDGVLTDQDAHPDHVAIGLLADVVERGASAALVTGRSRTWLEQHVLPVIRSGLSGADHGVDLCCAAEYGAVRSASLSASWDRDERYAVPDDLRDALRRITTSFDGAPFVEWDASKECMATVEARHGPGGDVEHRARTRAALDEYEREARLLAPPRGLDVQRATYAVDVAPPGLTKRVGAAWALDEFARLEAQVAELWVLGDSSGDVEMVRAAQDRGMPSVTFVWLGAGAATPPPGAAVIDPFQRFAAGTREVLTRLLGG